MKKISLFLLLIFSLCYCAQPNRHADNSAIFQNHLQNESSPYLLQHINNPVDWYPWNDATLAKAKEENKLIIISIGYAACHWCHVMENESFKDSTVAAFMNEHFVSIKIDREERPDLDKVYGKALQVIKGRVGWPLHIIALPDGRPIHGGVYYSKENWITMLSQVLDSTQQNSYWAERRAQNISSGMRNLDPLESINENKDYTLNHLNTIFHKWKKNIDYRNGGMKNLSFGINPGRKYPLPSSLQFLLHYHHLSQNKEALKAVTTALDKMQNGGIYDHIGGGFARFSTDSIWLVPHFEKMLYDNAQLVSIYAKAYQVTKKQEYKESVYQTLQFIEHELTSDQGGFYSSLDADTDGEEGKYYVWKYDDFRKITGADADLMSDYYSLRKEGNWEEGKNILHHTIEDKELENRYKLPIDSLNNKILKANQKLLTERKLRTKPKLDDKELCSWNALMLKGYSDAYRVFEEERYIKAAIKNAHFIQNNFLTENYRLYRSSKNGESSINGFLDDYAFTIDAFIALYQATFDEHWLSQADKLTAYALQHFFDSESDLFFYTSDEDKSLVLRDKEIQDHEIPASNSQMAKNLYMLGQYLYNDDYILKSKSMLDAVSQQIENGGVQYSNWNTLMAWFANEPYLVSIVGENCHTLRKEFDRYYLPNVFLSGGKQEGNYEMLKGKKTNGKTLIYACKNKVCDKPEESVKKVISLIKEKT